MRTYSDGTLHGAMWGIGTGALCAGFLILPACAASDPNGAGGTGGASTDENHESVALDSVEDDHAALVATKEGYDSMLVSPAPTNAIACTAHAQCATGYCYDGVCCDAPCNDKCMACTAVKKGGGVDGTCGPIKYDTDPDNECPDGACNGGYVCKKYNGVTCTGTAQCLSNYCVDGYCCGNLCMGACQACSAAKKGSGSNGSCGSIAATTDPDNECAGGECNGSAACSAPQTTLTNGTACVSSAQCQSGNCVDGVCCDSWCLGSCQACTAAKKGSGTDGTCGNIKYDTDPDEECWGGSCNGKGACRQYNGTFCSANAQCLSNYCVDGFCCGNQCLGSCQACSAVKKGQGGDGSCGLIASGRDPDNECSPGECNGSGTCNQAQTPQPIGASCTNSGQCQSGFCADKVCCDKACTSACEACTAAKKGSGANGTCGLIKYDTDPDDECWGGGCDGKGFCKQYNAVACYGTSECLSGYCTDGYCCNQACSGMFQACNLPQTPGSCKSSYPTPCTGALGLPGAPYVPQYVVGAGINRVSTLDLNGDGRLDLFTNRVSDLGYFDVLLGQGNGTFASPIKYTIGGSTTIALPLVDLNGDSRPDYLMFEKGADIVAVSFGQANGSFLAKTDYTTGDEPVFAKTVDLNGDGFLDIVTWNAVPMTVSILLNQGNGTFAAKVDYLVGNCTQSVVPVDLNADGKPELATICGNDNSVAVLTNQGNGTFAARVDFPTAQQPWSIAAVDVNADGKMDIVTGHGLPANQMSVLLNQGNGTLAAPIGYPTTHIARVIESPDLNGDGFPDLVTRDYYGGMTVLLNLGNGTFGPEAANTYTSTIAATRAVDLNGDQRLDYVVRYSSGDLVTVVLNQGNGTLLPKTDYDVNFTVQGVEVADVNADGRPEIVVVGNSAMAVLRNQGNGTFQQSDFYSAPDGYSTAAIGDFNGDNKPDFAAGANSSIVVRTNLGNAVFSKEGMNPVTTIPTTRQPTAIAAGDFNGDGKRDIAMYNRAENGGPPTVSVMSNLGNGTFGPITEEPESKWYTYAAAAADLNRNGYIEITEQYVDQMILLADFSGDGRIDLITYYVEMGQYGWGPSESIPDRHRLLVYKGDGASNFTLLGTYYLADAPAWPGAMYHTGMPAFAAADFNGDGRLDIAVATFNYATVWLNQGNATFTGTGNNWSKGWGGWSDYPTGVVAGDMNGDGKADVVVSWDAGASSLFLGQGNGTFASAAINVNGGGYTMRLADMTNDSRPDILMPTSNGLQFFPNLGNGTVGASNTYTAAASVVRGFYPVDLDNDDRFDIVTANDSSRSVSIMFNRCLP
jgi:hypothetical protein